MSIDHARLPELHDIKADGRLHRFPTNGKRDDRSGWYVLHDDGIPAGRFGCWRSGIDETWCQHIDRELTEDEKKENRERVDAMRRVRDAEEKKRRQEAAERAGELWESASPAPADHQYLVNKSISPHDLRVHDGRLVVPLRDAGGNLHSLQFIAPDGDKRYLPAGAIQGNHWVIGNLTTETPYLYICEGVATTATVHAAMGGCAVAAMSANNLRLVAEALHGRYPGARIIICGDDDHATAGNPGQKAAGEAAQAVAGIIAIPQFPQPRDPKATDWNDMALMSGTGAVKKQITDLLETIDNLETPPETDGKPNKSEDARVIAELASLPLLDYDRRRRDAAKQLGVRPQTLDKIIAERREAMASAAEIDGAVEDLNPWATPVDGAELANTIARLLSEHVALPAGATTAITLFAIGTFAMDAWRLWPKLLITSPEKRCGKTTLLEAIEAITCRSLLTASITASSLFRAIEAWTPCLLIDEADTFARDDDALNGVINAGHTKRTAVVIRSEKMGDTFEPKKFSVWCPMIISGIKSQRDTLHDRSIHIAMRRKLPGETIKKLPSEFFEDMRSLRQKSVRWAADNLRVLKACKPDVPNLGNDREVDNWQPIFAIAETIGGSWPQRVRRAYATLAAAGDDDGTVGPTLLNDLREVFDSLDRDVLHSERIVDELLGMEERPWSEWKHGRAMTKNSLAKLLKPFGIRSHQLKIGGVNKYGYRRADLDDAFARYCSISPAQTATTLQPSIDAPSGASANATDIATAVDGSATVADWVADEKPLKASQDAGCSKVAFQNGDTGTDAQFEDDL